MGKEILITDSLFIDKNNEKQLEEAGFSFTRLDKPEATEEELVEMIKGKHGYILGGIEKVTANVISAGNSLEAIVFTGAGYKEFIPAWQEATKRGIAIANTPGGNSASVAEYTTTLMLAMLRNIFELGRTGTKKFETTPSMRDTVVGIIGMGNVGKAVVKNVKALGAKEIIYFSKTRKPDLEKEFGIKYMSMEDVLKNSDIVTLHFSKDAGEKRIGEKELKLMKNGSILINVAFTDAVDFAALKKEIMSKRIRAAFDGTPNEEYSDLPIGGFFCSNLQTAYNTREAIATINEMATKSMINLLKTGEDRYLVNPEYKSNKK